MRTLGNILWHIPFLGFLSSLCTLLAGLLFLLTGIGIPIGLGLIQFARFLLTPFSCAMVSKNELQVRQNQLWLTWGWIARILIFSYRIDSECHDMRAYRCTGIHNRGNSRCTCPGKIPEYLLESSE